MSEETTTMTPEERELFDAKADHEAWSHAQSILAPWYEATLQIGSDELSWVMQNALVEVEDEVKRTRDKLEALEQAEIG